MATFASRFDVERLGMVPWASPRHSDLMIISGTVTIKMAPMLKRIYDQMPDPKWAVSMGSCANSGGPFRHGYHVVKGVDRVIPVDVYVPGCPPPPESLLNGLLLLQEQIAHFRTTGKRAAPNRRRPIESRDLTIRRGLSARNVSACPPPATAPRSRVTVPVERWVEAGRFVKDTLGCLYMSFSTAVDWKDQGLEVVARVENLDANFTVTMKTRLARRRDALPLARRPSGAARTGWSGSATTCSASGSRGIPISAASCCRRTGKAIRC